MKGGMSKPDELSEHGNKIPEFEVNEINSGLVGTLSLQNPFCNLLSCIDLGHHTHIHEMAVDAKELLGSTNLNVFEHFIANTSSEQCNIDIPVSVNSVIDTIMIDLKGTIVVEENSAIHPLISDESCSLQCSIYFQDVQILDIPDKVASLFDGMSQSDDLNFFMGARKGSVRKSFSGETTKRSSDKGMPCSKETPHPPALPLISAAMVDSGNQSTDPI